MGFLIDVHVHPSSIRNEMAGAAAGMYYTHTHTELSARLSKAITNGRRNQGVAYKDLRYRIAIRLQDFRYIARADHRSDACGPHRRNFCHDFRWEVMGEVGCQAVAEDGLTNGEEDGAAGRDGE